VTDLNRKVNKWNLEVTWWRMGMVIWFQIPTTLRLGGRTVNATDSTVLCETHLTTKLFNIYNTLYHTTCFYWYGHLQVLKLSFSWKLLCFHYQSQHTNYNKNSPSLWDTLAHRWDYMLYMTGATITEAVNCLAM
jgi:hypothetical protein